MGKIAKWLSSITATSETRPPVSPQSPPASETRQFPAPQSVSKENLPNKGEVSAEPAKKPPGEASPKARKGSIFDDALDDKEYEGNLIYLLQNGCDFVKNNSHVRFAKEARWRVDKPDYAERAVVESLVNALIHRDYLILGSEVHIDMYDDRLEISSPGGMFSGKLIQEQDIERIKSERRNPIIADLFHRMRYMERRGSGLKKIVNETKKLPGYDETRRPSFYSTDTFFCVVIPNMNYGRDPDVPDVPENVPDSRQMKVLQAIAADPYITTAALAELFQVTDKTIKRDLNTLKADGKLQRIGAERGGHWEIL